jgi:transposase-like protein
MVSLYQEGGVKMRGFREIEAEEKAQAVFEVIAGAKIVAVAGKYRVNRDSLSDWVRKVKEDAKEWLEPYKRGPKQKKLKIDPNLKKIEKLNELLARHQAEIEGLEDHLRKIKESERENTPRPVNCDRCGCKKAYRNGTYLVEPKRFFDLLKKREDPIPVPQFVCAICGHCLYLESDRILFFRGKVSPEIKRVIGILRWDGQMSLRNIQTCVLKIFGLELSLGFVYEELKRVCKKAQKIN